MTTGIRMLKKTRLFVLVTVAVLPFFVALTPPPSFSADPSRKVKLVEKYIAIFDLETVGSVDKFVSRPLSESIRREFVRSGRYEVIDRSNMDKILEEQKFQLSGCVSGQCIVEAGQLLGVGKIVAGTVSLVGKTYYLSLSIVNVESGKIEDVSEEECRCEIDELIQSSKGLVHKLLGEKRRVERKAGVIRPTGFSYGDPTTGMEFILVKGGCFEMGDTFGDGYTDEKPVHEVCVDNFYVGKHEVTRGQFRKFVSDTGYTTDAERDGGCYYWRESFWSGYRWEKEKGKNWLNPGFSQDDRHPAVCLSWYDTKAFLDWLNKKSEKNYRLPTEAEWEYAARGGGRKEKWAGAGDENRLAEHAWFDKNSGGKTQPVGQKKPNELGLYDMSGNAWEWVRDWYDEKYYAGSPKSNPSGGPASEQYRVLRGGSWEDEPRAVRTMYRGRQLPALRSYGYGFRLVHP